MLAATRRLLSTSAAAVKRPITVEALDDILAKNKAFLALPAAQRDFVATLNHLANVVITPEAKVRRAADPPFRCAGPIRQAPRDARGTVGKRRPRRVDSCQPLRLGMPTARARGKTRAQPRAR